jgi:phage terminase large subunit-like protein
MLPELHRGQIEAWNIPGRYKVIRCGRRWGKTAMSSTVVCDRVARGESWGIFAPDYKITSETYREIHTILDPIIASSSKIDSVIRVINGGRVDFWTLNNPRAGRSRKYHGVIIDEAAFVNKDMEKLWTQSIKPTLLDYGGVAWVLSTPCGKDEDNWFYHICTDTGSEFVEYHAPTAGNPYLPPDEVEKLKDENSPEVYRQEYLAEFVDWSGVAFFPIESLLVNGAPVPMPTKCDTILAIIDTAIKSGQEHDSTAVTYVSYNSLTKPCTIILDWDLQQIEGAAQEAWLLSIYQRCEQLARQCGARRGSSGALIEDKATGTVLIQQAKNKGHQARAIDSKLTSMGKDERAIAASPYVYGGDVKIADEAFNKTKVHKRVSANHLIKQVTNFRIGAKDDAADDALDTFCYAVLMTRGTSSGERKGI